MFVFVSLKAIRACLCDRTGRDREGGEREERERKRKEERERERTLTRKDWHSNSVSILCSDIRMVQVEKESRSVDFRALIVLKDRTHRNAMNRVQS